MSNHLQAQLRTELIFHREERLKHYAPNSGSFPFPKQATFITGLSNYSSLSSPAYRQQCNPESPQCYMLPSSPVLIDFNAWTIGSLCQPGHGSTGFSVGLEIWVPNQGGSQHATKNLTAIGFQASYPARNLVLKGTSRVCCSALRTCSSTQLSLQLKRFSSYLT